MRISDWSSDVCSSDLLKPSITVRQGEARKVIREIIAQTPDIAALVLATTNSGAPGPLVRYFASSDGGLPVPLMLVPGGLDTEAIRSEERRVEKECDSTCRARW